MSMPVFIQLKLRTEFVDHMWFFHKLLLKHTIVLECPGMLQFYNFPSCWMNWNWSLFTQLDLTKGLVAE